MRALLLVLAACGPVSAASWRTVPVPAAPSAGSAGAAAAASVPSLAPLPSLAAQASPLSGPAAALPALNAAALAQAAAAAAPEKAAPHAATASAPIMPDTPAPPGWKADVRAVMYGVIFSEDPAADAGRVVETLLAQRQPSFTREGLSRSVDAALASEEPLAKLLPQPHSEKTVRDFLGAVKKSLDTSR